MVPALLAGLFPILFIPTLTDAYVLPRSALAVAGGCLCFGWGLAAAGPRLGGLGPACVAVALAAGVAALFSIAPALSVAGSYARYESLPVRLSYLLLLAGTAWLATTRRSRELALTAFVAGCCVASAEALYEGATGFPSRPDGNLGQANLLGGLLAMAIPIVATRLRRQPLWGLALALLGAGILVSSSRSGWIGAAAGCAVIPALAARSPRRRALLLGGGGALVATGLALVLFSPLAALNGDTGAARLHVWKDALPLLLARPLTGYGEDALGLVFGGFQTGNWEPGATFDRVHQNVLDLVATQGLLGLGACAWLFAAWVAGCWPRGERAGEADPTLPPVLAALIGYTAFVQFNFDWAPMTAPAWLLAGLGWAASREAAAGTASPRLPAWAVGALGVTLLAPALVFGLLPLAADASATRGDPAAAVRLDPLQARYHRLLGERLAASGDPAQLARARGELARAAALGTYESALFIELGDLDGRLHDPDAAVADYRRAVALDPYDGTARDRLRQAAGK